MPEPLQQIEGKYEILQKLHEGGMGTVYKVRHRLLDEIRVIKVMRPQLRGDEELQARFLREARVAIQLKHPNIAQLYDFSFDPEGTAYIVMEFIDGTTLERLRDALGALPLPLAMEVGTQTLEALYFLHQKGFIHRDISPDNMILTEDLQGAPSVKLIDLGIAKALEDRNQTQLTLSGTFLGKMRYSSPEQFSEKGSEATDARSDLYSFGVVLYELVTGRHPISGDDTTSLMAGHVFRPPISFEETDPDGRVPQSLREAILRTLSKDPAERFADAGELLAILRAERRQHPLEGFQLAALLARVEDRSNRRQTANLPKAGSTQVRLDHQFGLESTPPPGQLPNTTLVATDLHATRRTQRHLTGRHQLPKDPTKTWVASSSEELQELLLGEVQPEEETHSDVGEVKGSLETVEPSEDLQATRRHDVLPAETQPLRRQPGGPAVSPGATGAGKVATAGLRDPGQDAAVSTWNAAGQKKLQEALRKGVSPEQLEALSAGDTSAGDQDTDEGEDTRPELPALKTAAAAEPAAQEASPEATRRLSLESLAALRAESVPAIPAKPAPAPSAAAPAKAAPPKAVPPKAVPPKAAAPKAAAPQKEPPKPEPPKVAAPTPPPLPGPPPLPTEAKAPAPATAKSPAPKAPASPKQPAASQPPKLPPPPARPAPAAAAKVPATAKVPSAAKTPVATAQGASAPQAGQALQPAPPTKKEPKKEQGPSALSTALTDLRHGAGAAWTQLGESLPPAVRPYQALLVGGAAAGLLLFFLVAAVLIWQLGGEAPKDFAKPLETPPLAAEPEVPAETPTEPAQSLEEPAQLHPELRQARIYLEEGAIDKARESLQFLREQVSLRDEELAELALLEQQLSESETLPDANLSQDLIAAIESGRAGNDVRRLLRAVEAARLEDPAAFPELDEVLPRARDIERLHLRMWQAKRSGDYPAMLDHATGLAEVWPAHTDAAVRREEAAAALEAAARERSEARDFSGALGQLALVEQHWPDRPGLAAEISTLRERLSRDEEMEALLDRAAEALSGREPERGLEILEGINPSATYRARFESLRQQLRARITELDAQPPTIRLLTPDEELGYKRNDPLQLSLSITDDRGVESMTAWVRPEGDSKYRQIPLQESGDRFQITVPAAVHGGGKFIDFYVEATDASGHKGNLGTKESPRRVEKKTFFDRFRRDEG